MDVQAGPHHLDYRIITVCEVPVPNLFTVERIKDGQYKYIQMIQIVVHTRNVEFSFSFSHQITISIILNVIIDSKMR